MVHSAGSLQLYLFQVGLQRSGSNGIQFQPQDFMSQAGSIEPLAMDALVTQDSYLLPPLPLLHRILKQVEGVGIPVILRAQTGYVVCSTLSPLANAPCHSPLRNYLLS